MAEIELMVDRWIKSHVKGQLKDYEVDYLTMQAAESIFDSPSNSEEPQFSCMMDGLMEELNKIEEWIA